MAMTPETKDERELVAGYLSRFADMQAERRLIEPLFKEVTDNLYPFRAGWDFGDDSDWTAIGRYIFDGEAIAAHSRLSEGLFGWLVSPALDWLYIEPKDRKRRNDPAALRYCTDLRMALYDIFEDTNFYDAIAQDFKDGAALGTTVIQAEEDEATKMPIYLPLHLREVYISEDYRQHVDTLYRNFELTGRVLLEKFEDSLDAETKKAVEKRPEQKYELLHVQEPRKGGKEGASVVAGLKKMTSDYVLLGPSSSGTASALTVKGKKLLKSGGTDMQMFEAWRFYKRTSSVWGGCPAFDAIFDTKMMNLMSRTMGDAAQLAARVPLMAPESLRGKVRATPGGITYRERDSDKVEPVMTSISYPIGMDAMERRARIIREHFKSDYFQSTSGIQQGSRERTRTEIMEMKAESAATMGTILGRIQSERLDPLIAMTIRIGMKNGLLPEAPRELAGVDLKVRYVGPLMQSQRKYIQVNGLLSGLSAGLQLQPLDPYLPYNVKINDAFRQVLLASGFPPELLEDKQKAEKAIGNAQAAAAQAQQAQARNEYLAASGRGAKTPEPGSPTAITMGGGQ